MLEDLTSIRKDITNARYLLYDPGSKIIEVITKLGTAINKLDILIQNDDKNNS